MSSQNADISKVWRCSCKKVSVEFTTPDGKVWREVVVDHRCPTPAGIAVADNGGEVCATKSDLKHRAMKYYMSTLECVVKDVDE